MKFSISLTDVIKTYRLQSRRSQLETLKSALLGKRSGPVPPAQTITALTGITFNVHEGEAFGVIGRNGSGKSTLLKIISEILKPTSGSVAVNGRISALIELGAGFHPEISGRENIFINGIMLGLTKKEVERRFDEIVEFSGVAPEFLEQPVKTYSSGMYVRLGFSVAVHTEPDILLIDEVLAVGDEEFSQKCIAKIQELKFRGVTMLFVTHQLDQVRTLCDRALWLDHGAMVGLGDPVRVIDDYLQNVSGLAPIERDEEAPVPSPEPPADVANDLTEEERWGSGELLLGRVALTDAKGHELVALGGSGTVAIEMDVKVRQPQTDFVFGIGIYHADGSCVYGTNTDLEGWASEQIEKDGRVRFVMPSLDLVAGSYRIDAAVHTKSGRAYDYRRGVLRFVVGSRVHDVGYYRPAHEWKFDEGIALKRSGDIDRNVPSAIAETLKTMKEEEASEREQGKFKKRKTRE